MTAKLTKVAEVVTRMDWGGSPDIVRITCRSLDPQLFDTKVITGPTKHPSLKTGRFMEEWKDRLITVPTLMRDVSPLNDLRALFDLYAIFRREKFDVVHTHTAKAGALGRIAARMAGVPVVVHTPHGHNLYGYFGGAFSLFVLAAERMLTTFADKIIALTALEKRDYEHYRVAGPDKVTLIYQGLELDEGAPAPGDGVVVRRELGIRPGDKVAGMVARLEEIKGPGFFVDAARLILKKFPEARFVMVGDGSLREELEDKIKNCGIAGSFIMTGWRDDVKRLMSSFDVMVLPSLNEAVGIALIEAQAEGVPVIASNVGGIPEIIDDGRTGMLVRARDAEDIARAVTVIFSDDRKRAELSNQARAWVRGRFEAKDMASRVAALYMELLKDKQNK